MATDGSGGGGVGSGGGDLSIGYLGATSCDTRPAVASIMLWQPHSSLNHTSQSPALIDFCESTSARIRTVWLITKTQGKAR